VFLFVALKMNKEDEDFSSPKRRLLEAKQKDAFFDSEIKTLETKKVTKKISQDLVSFAVSRAVGNLSTVDKNQQTESEDSK
jgi:hypothetical protein